MKLKEKKSSKPRFIKEYDLYARENENSTWKFYKTYWNIGHAKSAIAYKFNEYSNINDNPYKNYEFKIVSKDEIISILDYKTWKALRD